MNKLWNKTWLLSIGLTALVLAGLALTQHHLQASSANTPTRVPSEDAAIRQQYLDAVVDFDRTIIALDSALVRFEQGAPADSVRLAFRNARNAYKAIQMLVERYSPVTAQLMNGPAIDKPNEDMPTVAIPPHGFQVIEASLFPEAVREDVPAMRQETAVLRVGVKRILEITSFTRFTNEHLFDAARVEYARIVTLGLAGFDASLSLNALPEAAASLRGIRAMFARFEPEVKEKDMKAWTALDAAFDKALHTLDTATSFDAFDRLHFIVANATPLAQATDRVREILGVPRITDRRPWKTDAITVFESGAFDLSAYAPPYAQNTSQAVVDLGCALFSDPLLSESQTRSCASCHHPSQAFTDGLPAPNSPGLPRRALTTLGPLLPACVTDRSPGTPRP